MASDYPFNVFKSPEKRCTRLADASENVYQLFVHVRWFSPGTPASSATKTGHHDTTEILLKVTLNTKNQIKSSLLFWYSVSRKCTRYDNRFYPYRPAMTKCEKGKMKPYYQYKKKKKQTKNDCNFEM